MMQGPRPPTGELLARLVARQPNCAPAQAQQSPMRHTDDDFVGLISSAAAAFLAKLPKPEAGSHHAALDVPPVPPHLAEEILAFADYALLDELQIPSVDAIMLTITVPRAVQLCQVCARFSRGPGYEDLQRRCIAYLARNFRSMQQDPAYTDLTTDSRMELDDVLHTHVDGVLRSGDREALTSAQDAIMHHIAAGRFTLVLLEHPDLVRWLCEDASVKVWHGLADHGHDLAGCILHDRAAAFFQAAGAKRGDLVSFMWEATPLCKRDALWAGWDCAPLRVAIQKNCASTVTALLRNLTPKQREAAANTDIWRTAASSGRGEMTAVLHRWLPDRACEHVTLVELALWERHDMLAQRLLHAPVDSPEALDAWMPALAQACAAAVPDCAQAILRTAAPYPALLRSITIEGMRQTMRLPYREACSGVLMSMFTHQAGSCGFNVFTELLARDEDEVFDILGTACGEGHLPAVENLLACMSPEQRCAYLYPPGNKAMMSPLVRACETLQHPIVNLLLEHAASPKEQAEMVLQGGGQALFAATRADVETTLVNTLQNVARQDPQAWRAWLTEENLHQALQCAAMGDLPMQMFHWLEHRPETEHASLIEESRLVVMALACGATRILKVVFRMTANDVPLQHRLAQACFFEQPDLQLYDTALATALQYGYLDSAERVLGTMSPALRKEALVSSFDSLCGTDKEFFLAQWDTLSPDDQARLLAPNFMRYRLPYVASGDVAAHIVQHHPEAFANNLAQEDLWLLDGGDALTVQAMIEAAPPGLRLHLLKTWAPALLLASRVHGETQPWHFLRRHLDEDALLALLEGPDVLQPCDFNLEEDARTLLPWLLLGDAWIRHPEKYGGLARRAMHAVVAARLDILLLEILAQRPEAQALLPNPRNNAVQVSHL